MNGNRRRTVWVVVALGFIVALFALPRASDARVQRSVARLRDKLRSAVHQREKLQTSLKSLKRSQGRYRNRLVGAQVDLDEAERRLVTTARRLARTKKAIARTKKALLDSQRRLDRHSEQMGQRILLAYRSPETGYVDVLLEAGSFGDFVNRAEFARRMVEQDTRTLRSIVVEKRQIEGYKAELEQRQQEQAELLEQTRADKLIVAQRAEEALQRLKRANADRAEAERQLAEMEAESAAIEARLGSIQRGESGGARYTGTWSGSLSRPVGGRITSGFGWRIHPLTHTRRFHDGVDLACSYGTTIHAAAAGVVVHAGWQGVYGKVVLIDHGSGIATMYAHCSEISVSYGQRVKRGQAIAAVGSTGWSTGPHLHFGLRKYGKPISPL
jgi:murein DD-endopeptidase MepM/ murein hydrolase activator NlpD